MKLSSWIKYPVDSDFSIYNIPFGIAKSGDTYPFVASRIGDLIIDMRVVAGLGLYKDLNIPDSIWESHTLNAFISLGKTITYQVRERLQSAICDIDSPLKTSNAFIQHESCEMLLPVKVGDYTDFYSSYYHAYNVGCMFRDPKNALMPNWRHLPVGYHGRASSIIVDGTSFHRPKGQTIPKDAERPIFGPSQRMDFELEMGFIVGKSSQLGETIPVDQASEYIFGMVLFNDWSARDIQKWEYVPLGPFLGKNFASTMSPWVVTLEALTPFRVKASEQDEAVLPYLQQVDRMNYDINLTVGLTPNDSAETIITNSNYKHMYWTIEQQLAHHTINGCNINVGDVMASGTISGPTPDSYGSMLELSWAGSKQILLKDGQNRKFMKDHDTISLYGHGQKENIRVGFGSARGTLLPST